MANPSFSRIGAGLACAAVAGAATAAVESLLEAGPEGLGPGAITFVVLFALYGFVALCSVGAANLLWLIGRSLLGRFEPFLLPLLASGIAWQILTGTRWGLISDRATMLCTGLIFIGYLFAPSRLQSASAAR